MNIAAQEPVLLPALLMLGIVAGFLSGLLGIGGGIILVPGLFAVFKTLGFPEDLIMHMAVGTSLAIIVPTGFSSARAHKQKKAIDWGALVRIGPGILLGTWAGVMIADHLPGAHLSLIFLIVLVFLTLVMISSPERFALYKEIPRQPFPALAGGVIGLVSSLIGIGGATLSVPYMSLCSIPIHRAIGTAAALGLLISIPSSVGFMYIGRDVEGLPPFSLGYVFLPAWLAIVAVSVLSAPAGAAAAHRLPVSLMRAVFALFMVIVATKMAAELFE